jgi:Protein of unknown function (DUF3105)
MAQRKSPPGGKPAAKKGTTRPAGKPAATPSAKVGAAPRKAPPRKPGKSIVHQKQTPWGAIISIAAVVAFAAAVVIVVIATRGGGGSDKGAKCSGANSRYCLPELAAAKQIKGVTYKIEPNHEHVTHAVKYDATPPIGGDHSAYWADADGTVYPHPIANENAVHILEHGGVWLTYREGLPASEVATLANDVKGQKYVMMSPYPNLRTKVSLQAWGYQLFVDDVNDPRIAQFIGLLAGNIDIAPEQNGSYQQPTFKAHPSTFGHPLFAPVTGTANTMSGSATP